MKINNTNIGTSGINPYKQQMNKLENMNKEANQKTDKVEISAEAKELQRLENARKEKVEQIKLQVEDGSYKINPQEVANSMANYYSSIKK